MTELVICWRRITEAKAVIQRCPTCARRRRMLAEHEDWYGWTVTCLTCGDVWQDGERCPRPFEPGWRKRSVTSAKARLARVGEENVSDEEPRLKAGD